MQRSRLHFADAEIASVNISSTWNSKTKKSEETIAPAPSSREHKSSKSNSSRRPSLKSKEVTYSTSSCQTAGELYTFKDAEVQSGIQTAVTLTQVTESSSGLTLLEYLTKKNSGSKGSDASKWKDRIEQGFVSVDCEATVDPDQKLSTDVLVEFVDSKISVGVPDDSPPPPEKDSKATEPSHLAFSDYSFDRKLESFILKVAPVFLAQLKENDQANQKGQSSNRMYIGDKISGGAEEEAVLTYWRLLTVDLEKRKVVFPDWTQQAKHYPAVVQRCVLTRNKERVYDIEYDDGSKLSGVREEYIRLLGGNQSISNIGNKIASRLQEGVRVHAKITFKGGVVKYLPGRVMKCYRSSASSGAGGVYDVECEGSRLEKGLTVDSLTIGLTEGQRVEARRSSTVLLQCTGTSWNATGSSLAVSYGRNDVLGWCDFPGAVCCWNIFGRTFTPENPDFVLDHTSCLTCVSYHPLVPSLVAAGSFIGEVIVWDLTNPETPLAISPIIEYSHKEPVQDLKWVYNIATQPWLLCSVSAEGRILFWSLENKFLHPVKGSSLSKGKVVQRRQFPSAHGASCISFSTPGRSDLASAAAGNKLSKPKWVLVGQQGGAVARGQVSRLLGGQHLNPESFKSGPTPDELFLSVKSADDTFNHLPHIGSVNCIDCSPFHRNLFLTAGSDGTVKLFHILERTPLRQWEPLPPPGSTGVSGQFSSVTAVRFSPIRPLIFAAATIDGFLYVFDLSRSSSAPLYVVEALMNPVIPTSKTSNNAGSSEESNTTQSQSSPSALPAFVSKRQQRHSSGPGSSGAPNTRTRIGITGLAFNHKQRDLIAACDFLGRVHIWKLSWLLSSRGDDELNYLNKIGHVNAAMEDLAL